MHMQCPAPKGRYASPLLLSPPYSGATFQACIAQHLPTTSGHDAWHPHQCGLEVPWEPHKAQSAGYMYFRRWARQHSTCMITPDTKEWYHVQQPALHRVHCTGTVLAAINVNMSYQ